MNIVSQKKFKASENIFDTESPCLYFYAITQGSVILISEKNPSSEPIVLKCGGIFGLEATTDKRVYSYKASAYENCTCMKINVERLKKTLSGSSMITRVFLEKALNHLYNTEYYINPPLSSE